MTKPRLHISPRAALILFPFGVFLMHRAGWPLAAQLAFAALAVALHLDWRAPRTLLPSLTGVGLLGAALAATRPENLPRLYPFLLSATALAAFWSSWRGGANILEQYAASFVELDDTRRLHLRRMLPIWVFGLALNTLVSLALVFTGPLEWWLLWSGGLSYLWLGFLLLVTLRGRLIYGVKMGVGFGLFGIACLLSMLALPVVRLIFYAEPLRVRLIAREAVRYTFTWVLWYLRHVLRFLDVKMERHAPSEDPRLIVSNHISMFDIITMLAYVRDVGTFVKSTHARIPMVRHMVKACGFIPIDVNDPEQRTLAFMKALEALRAGERFVVFPEGTRSESGALRPFQAGVFRLALESGVPITPMLVTADKPLFNKREHFRPELGMVHFALHLMPQIPVPQGEASPAAARALRDEVQTKFTRWLASDLAKAYNRLIESTEAHTMLTHHDMIIRWLPETTPQKLAAEVHLTARHPHLDGHFDGYPVLPGISQVDLVLRLLSEALGRTVALTRVERTKFTAILKPQTTFRATIEVDCAEARWSFEDQAQLYSRGTLAYGTP